MLDDTWKGEHLIRKARRTQLAEAAPKQETPAEKVMAVRNAALAGMSRVEATDALDLSYNSVVWICQKHDISFPDGRRSRAIEGRV